MGLIVQSGNDAAIVLAEGIAGSEEDFAIQMNQYAGSLEMKNTHFTNSTGWPHEDLKTTAYDLIILTEALIENFPKLYKLFLEKEFNIFQYTHVWNCIYFLDTIIVKVDYKISTSINTSTKLRVSKNKH